MRRRIFEVVSAALLLPACSGPPSETLSLESHHQALSTNSAPTAATHFLSGGAARFGRTLTPRPLKSPALPRGLRPHPTRVMVSMSGDPITVVQSRTPDRKLSSAEKSTLRDALRAAQAPLRQSMESLGATVVHDYQNAYNGFSIDISSQKLAALRSLPGVTGIHPSRVMRKSLTHAVPFVAAPKAWSSGPTRVHGEGIKVAVLDTGIDYTHANFGGPGTPAAYEAAHANETLPADPALFGPKAPRVKGGIDLVGDAYNEDLNQDTPGTSIPQPDPNPLDCEGHGSHVAGIVGGSGVTADGHTYAGPYDTTTYSHDFKIGPGVAPRVDLYAVRVFGCEGSVSNDIVVDAMEWAVDNDMDVINLSLGSPWGAVDDPESVAASNAVAAGVVVVVAAGNSGPNPYLAGSPSTGTSVLSAAAMDATTPLLPGASLALSSGANRVQNSNGGVFADGTTYPIVVLGTPDNVGLGCDAADYARPDVPGALVVTLRGTCDRVARAQLGQAAGAAAVAMINTSPGYPPIEGTIAGVTIPFFGVLPDDAAALTASPSAVVTSTTVENATYQMPTDFTSGGPRFGDSGLKPNLIAPGLSIVSTGVGTGTEGVTESGTSMASPMIAGLAALTRQAHGGWSALDIAAAVTNTADPTLVVGYSTRHAGAGGPQADRSTKTEVTATSGGDPGVSFGFLELDHDISQCQDVVVHNHDKSAVSFDVTVPPSFLQGAPHSLSLPSRIRVPAFGSAKLPLQLALSEIAATDALTFTDFAGLIQLTPSSAHANHGLGLTIPYYGVVRPEARMAAKLDQARHATVPSAVKLSNRGSVIPGTGDFYAWGISGTEDPIGCNDVRAVGVQSIPDDTGDHTLVFAINGWRRCSSSATNEYDILLTNEAGDQFVVVGADTGLLQGTGEVTGELGTLILNVATGDSVLLPAFAPTDSNMVYLVALGSLLNLTADQPRFAYLVQTSNVVGASDPDAPTDTATFNAFSSALIGQGQFVTVAPNETATVSIAVDPVEWTVTPPKGVMVVFAENAPRPEQEAVLFPITPPTPASSAAPASPAPPVNLKVSTAP
jgi:minor extracellular serine protease Vpr